MESFEELLKRLNEISKMGFIKTHRVHNTGIGKTLEDLLGIEENNVPSPDAGEIELKSARKNSSSFLTLFTKSPLPKGANAVLLKRYGYPSARGNNKKELHTTVNALRFNKLKGNDGFKIEVLPDKLSLVSIDGIELGYWDQKTLKNKFEIKLPKLVYVLAESRGNGANEEFWYNEAWLLSGFAFDSFVELVKEGTILVDIRIGQYPDGRPHDHGTGFRVHPDKLELCFKSREKII